LDLKGRKRHKTGEILHIEVLHNLYFLVDIKFHDSLPNYYLLRKHCARQLDPSLVLSVTLSSASNILISFCLGLCLFLILGHFSLNDPVCRFSTAISQYTRILGYPVRIPAYTMTILSSVFGSFL
jgi:hypothetical protein